MAGKGGGAWKVAYADFVTAMMAFFMVMWLISQNDKVKQAVADHFRNPSSRYAMGDSLYAPKHPQYFKDHRPMMQDGNAPQPPQAEKKTTRQPHTIVLYHGNRSMIGTAVFFADGVTELDDAARQRLLDFVPRALGKPQKVEIRGHAAASARSSGLPDATWEMSYQRCVQTRKFLEQQGIPARQIRLSQAGMFEPYSIGDVPEQLALNSRVEVFLLNEIAEDAVGTRAERDQKYRNSPGTTPAPSAAKGASP